MIGVIIVNYKTDDRVIQYATEELPKIATPHKVVIVNNACTEQSNHRIALGCNAFYVKATGDIDLLANIFVLGVEDNLGFARGNNLGAEFLLKHFNPDYILISNCDLRFVENNIIETLAAKMEACPDIGLIGPRIKSPFGKRETPVNHLSIWKKEIVPKLLYPLFVFLAYKKIPLFPLIGSDVEGGYDLLNGSFYLVRTSAFVKAGMFDPATFLYSEEPILAIRIQKAGFRVYYSNVVSVIHEHGVTEKTHKLFDMTMKYRYESNRYYQKEYKKVNRFELVMFDLAYLIFCNIWLPFVNLVSLVRQQYFNPWLKRGH